MDEWHGKDGRRRGYKPARTAQARITRRQQVYDYIASRGVRGATDREITEALNFGGVRTRRGELLHEGRIREAIGVGLRDGCTVWFTLDQATAREGLERESPLLPDSV